MSLKSNIESVPFVRYGELNKPRTPALWHFDNFEKLMEDGRAHFGDASGHPFWLFMGMEMIQDLCHEPETFSSRAQVPIDPDPPYMWIPDMLDPPEHTKWRKLLQPLFSPAVVARWTPRIHARFDEILDEVVPRGSCDFVADVAMVFPNIIFLEILGLPVSDHTMFQRWEDQILRGAVGHEDSFAAMDEVTAYFADVIKERRRQPKDDMLSAALAFNIDGSPVSSDDLLSMCLLLFMAGLDTVATQLSYSVLHLATHPVDRERLVDDPSLVPSAVEELLRFYSFITPGRKVVADKEFHGCPVQAGQMVHFPLVTANRDPLVFDDADRVLLDRLRNRHIAFGTGPHRCLGSHLAREELKVGLAGWHKRVPEYRISGEVQLEEHGGQIGLMDLPLTWDPS